jgi:hypothetical protein
LGFFNAQHALRMQIPKAQRTTEQLRLLDIHPNILNFPVQLSIDMGRLLNLRKVAAEHPGIESADLQDKYIFQKLHNQLEEAVKVQLQTTATDATAVSKSVSADQKEAAEPASPTSTPEWNPHSAEDTYLRLCTFKVWCDKYEREEEWSPSKMTNEWLQEAIQLYNHVSYHWSSCRVKQYPPQLFNEIRSTCISTWLRDVTERAGKGKKPSGNFITDWCTPPVVEKRHEWESYCCSVIMQAKNIAKLLGMHEMIPHDEPMEAEEQQSRGGARASGEPVAKRTRTEAKSTQEIDEKLMPFAEMVRGIVREELGRLHRYVRVLDTNEMYRHNEVMREMGGHMRPISTQMYHLSHNIAHMHSVLDKLNTGH